MSGLAFNEYPAGITNKQRTEQYAKLRNMPDGPEKQKAEEELARCDGRNRAYLGWAQSSAAMLTLADTAGNDRLWLRVDTLGIALIEFLNDSGRVVRTISEREQSPNATPLPTYDRSRILPSTQVCLAHIPAVSGAQAM